MGHRVSLLPAQYVRAYVRRNKTDTADIKIVPIKTQYKQMIQLMHRTRDGDRIVRRASRALG